MSKHKFKDGGYAIYMGIRSGICIVRIHKRFGENSAYQYLVKYHNTDYDDGVAYTETGHYIAGDAHPILLPCTQENLDAVNTLYDTNLCMPKTIVDKLRDYFKANGGLAKPVLCEVWDDDYSQCKVVLIVTGIVTDGIQFCGVNGTLWSNAKPYDGAVLTAKDFE